MTFHHFGQILFIYIESVGPTFTGRKEITLGRAAGGGFIAAILKTNYNSLGLSVPQFYCL